MQFHETGSVRFVSVPDFENCSVRFGLAIYLSGSMWFGLRFVNASWFGPVRFRLRFRPVPELSGSVRFGSAGPVRFLIPSCLPGAREAADERCRDQPQGVRVPSARGSALEWHAAASASRHGGYVFFLLSHGVLSLPFFEARLKQTVFPAIYS